VIALPAAYFVREPDAPAPKAGAAPISLRSVLSHPGFYLLMIGSMASIGAVGGTMQNLALYLRLDRGLPQVSIDTTLSLILLGSVIGRLFMGWLADRWPKQRVMLLIYTIVALAIPPLFYAPTPELLFVCAFIFGIGLGGDYMIIPLMAADMYGLAVMGRVMGVVLTADSVSEAVVPMIVAAQRDATGSYAGGFAILVGLAVVGALAVSFLRKGPARARNAENLVEPRRTS
jgi:MFS family permease